MKLEETTVQLLLFADELMLVTGKDEDVESLRMLDEVIKKMEDADQLEEGEGAESQTRRRYK